MARAKRGVYLASLDLDVFMIPSARLADGSEVDMHRQEPELFPVDTPEGARGSVELLCPQVQEAPPFLQPGHLTQTRLLKNSNTAIIQGSEDESQGASLGPTLSRVKISGSIITAEGRVGCA